MELVSFLVGTVVVFGSGPKLEDIKIAPIESRIEATVYGYTSLPELTDSTPFHTASGERVSEGIIANNCLPFNSIVFVDGKLYQVKDRMNERYGCQTFDIFFDTYSEAKTWGKQKKEVIILGQAHPNLIVGV